MILRRTLSLMAAALVIAVTAVNAQTQPLKVIATYSILADVVQNVAGDNIDLTVLVGADGDTHVYEPSPQDAIALAQADLIFENGLEFESWLDALYDASGSTAIRVAVSDGVEALAFGGHHDEDHADDHADEEHTDEHLDEEHDHEHGEFDPHIWHDPNLMAIAVGNIRDALITADATNADAYTTNADAYIAQLVALDEYIREQVALIPEANRVLVTSHDTFAYFAQAYGFTVLTVLESASTESSGPGAGQIASLIEEIRATGVPAVFAENVSNPALLEQIATEAGVELVATLYTDALGAAGTPGETYLSMVRHNVDAIVEALQ